MEASKNILSGNYGDLQIPGILALVAAAVSIVSKEAMFWYTKINAARFILKAAYDIFKDAVNKLVDHSCDEETERQIYDRAMQNEEVAGIDSLHTRISGSKIYVN